MAKKFSQNISAVIEIAPHLASMQISQLKGNKIDVLEKLDYPISLGSDVLSDGKVSFESIRELSSILTKYSDPIELYGVGKTKVISCSILRDAENRALVMDQIKVQNDMHIDVLEERIESSYIFYDMVQEINSQKEQFAGNTLLAYIGSDSIGLAIYNGENIFFSRDLPTGVIKLNDIVNEVRRDSDDFYFVIEEYIDAILKSLHLPDIEISNIVFTGNEISKIVSLTKTKELGSGFVVSVKKLETLYQNIKSKTPENLALTYNITEHEANVFYSALFLYVRMLRFCENSNAVFYPDIDIVSSMTKNLLIQKRENAFYSFVSSTYFSCAESIALKWGYDRSHSELISTYACQIFDRMKRIHGLDPRYKDLLKLAAILYECPKKAGFRRDAEAVYQFINGLDIFGLGYDELSRVAFIASSCADVIDFETNEYFTSQTLDSQVFLSKLAAIFRLATTLNKSRKQKLSNVRFTLKDNVLSVKADSLENIALEKWAFEIYSDYFKSVFGISPELKLKNIIM